MVQGGKREAAAEVAVLLRVLCPVDRIEAVLSSGVLSSNSKSGPGSDASRIRIRFDCASASPFPSDRVLLVSSSSSPPPPPPPPSQIQAALLSVFERIVLPPPPPPPPPPHHPHPHPHPHPHQHQVIFRLLSPSSQVASILGPGGITLDRLCQDSAAQIRVFPKDHAFPDFNGPGAPHDHLVTISGTFPAVKKALLAISALLLDHAAPTTLQQTCTATTQVLLPSHYLPFLTAPDASHLSHIKQMSGANLTVEDPKPGEATGKVIIFGTAEQTKTAQSLVHGLIFCGVFNPS